MWKSQGRIRSGAHWCSSASPYDLTHSFVVAWLRAGLSSELLPNTVAFSSNTIA